MAVRLSFVSFILAAGMVSQAIGQSADAVAVTPDRPSGQEVYLKQYCGLCHTLDRVGTSGIFGPTHNGLARTAESRIRDSLYTGRARTPAEYVRESIVEPQDFIVPGYEASPHRMPAYRHLADEEIDALVAFLLDG